MYLVGLIQYYMDPAIAINVGLSWRLRSPFSVDFYVVWAFPFYDMQLLTYYVNCGFV